MINIEEINLGLSTCNGLDWVVVDYKPTDVSSVIVVFLSNNNTHIYNYDGNKLGVKLLIPEDVQSNWGTDDKIIEDYILNALGATRL